MITSAGAFRNTVNGVQQGQGEWQGVASALKLALGGKRFSSFPRGILLSVPWSERVPALTLRLTTRCRRLRSAALFSGSTSACETKTNNSLVNRSMRRQSLACGANESSEKGRPLVSFPSSRFDLAIQVLACYWPRKPASSFRLLSGQTLRSTRAPIITPPAVPGSHGPPPRHPAGRSAQPISRVPACS